MISALVTDLYQITMAYGYWKTQLYNREAVFHLFYRKNPFAGNYAIFGGLEPAIEYLNNFKFTPDDVHYLGSLKGYDGKALFDEGFLNYLQRLKLNISVEAPAEGSIVFPHEPLLRIQGDLVHCQLVETALLNIINFSTLIATKARRIVNAAEGDTVLEFGLRRAQGPDGGLMASRAAYVGGVHATSHVLAGQRYGIPVRGTHAHSWVMSFGDEVTAFEEYAFAMPGNCTFLVDTFDTIEGVKNAIKVAKGMNVHLNGVRLDSGDLAELSRAARVLLDEAGFHDTQIVASNDLDEYEIVKLKAAGAAINVWGIGTRLVTAYDQPALGGVYKLGAIRNEHGDWESRIKLSEQPIKVSNPGVLNVRRYSDANGQPLKDEIYDIGYGFSVGEHHQNLLQPIFKEGQLVYTVPSLSSVRDYANQQFELFKPVLDGYPVDLERELNAYKMSLIAAYKAQK